jgi:hypothetical protein
VREVESQTGGRHRSGLSSILFYIGLSRPGGALQAHPTGASDDAGTSPRTRPDSPALARLDFSGRMDALLTRPGTRPALSSRWPRGE